MASVQKTESNGKHESKLSDTGSLETWATNDSFSSPACSAADSWSVEKVELPAENL